MFHNTTVINSDSTLHRRQGYIHLDQETWDTWWHRNREILANGANLVGQLRNVRSLRSRYYRARLHRPNVHPGDAGHPPSRDTLTVFSRYLATHAFSGFHLSKRCFLRPFLCLFRLCLCQMVYPSFVCTPPRCKACFMLSLCQMLHPVCRSIYAQNIILRRA